MVVEPGVGWTSVKNTALCSLSKSQERQSNQYIGCLISLIRDQNAKPYRQQDTELNVGEFLEQLQLDEQRLSEHGGKDRQHVHQQTSNSSSSEESFEEAQKNW